MEGGKVCDDSNMTILLKTESLPCSSEVLDSFWISNSNSSFHGDSVSGSISMINFEDARDRPFFSMLDTEENCNEDYDECFRQPEKKRRLAADQVQFLERSFEVEYKLEQERKVQLAKELGLQPRQVAIWFQNRRARYKTKQLEKDYDCLKASYDKLKAEFDCLLKENEKLRNEVNLLTDKSILRDEGEVKSEPYDHHPINPLDAESHKPVPNTVSQNASSSAKSDVFDGNHSYLLESAADSSHAFELDQSDFSQDEEDNLRRSLLLPPGFIKFENGCYYDNPPDNSCNLECPVEDQAFWFWSY